MPLGYMRYIPSSTLHFFALLRHVLCSLQKNDVNMGAIPLVSPLFMTSICSIEWE